MQKFLKPMAATILVVVFIILPAMGRAADFELFWDPNCGADPALEGYYVYYMEDASVVDAPSSRLKFMCLCGQWV